MTTAFIYPAEKKFAAPAGESMRPPDGERRRRLVSSAIRVLIVAEDENRFHELRALCPDLQHGAGAVHWLAHYETAREALFREAYDVVVLDHPQHGLELLRDMARGGTDTPALVLVGDGSLTRDAAGVTCEFLARDAIGEGRLQTAIADVVHRACAVRAATRSQMWWRYGGRTLSHATAFPAPPEIHGNVFVCAAVPDAPPYELDVHPHLDAGAGTRTGNGREDHDGTYHTTDELLPSLLNNLPIIAGHLDRDGTILDCGGAGLTSLGLSAASLRGQNIFTLPGVPADAIRQAAHGTPVKFIRSWICDGRPRHFECHLRFDPARAGGVIGFACEVTERVQAERERAHRDQLLGGILRHVPALTGRLDGAGHIDQVEGTGLVPRGLDPRQLNGSRFVDLFPATAKAVDCALGGGATRFETCVQPGTPEEWRAECSLFFDRGRGTGAMFFVQDVTARRTFERQIVQAVDAERQRIGADLHDDVGQLLTGISCLSTALVERLRGRDDLAAEDAATVAGVAQEALTQIRLLARGLAPTRRANAGLPDALENLRQQMRRMHDAELDLQLSRDDAEFDRETAAHLLRIVQEATTNAIRHGEATRIEVALCRHNGEHRLSISDNGCGFDPQKRARAVGSGLGLMEYRAALIGGTFKIFPLRAGGTRIEVSFTSTAPCHHENAC